MLLRHPLLCRSVARCRRRREAQTSEAGEQLGTFQCSKIKQLFLGVLRNF